MIQRPNHTPNGGHSVSPKGAGGLLFDSVMLGAVLVVSVAVGLRVNRVARTNLWNDEVFTVHVVNLGLVDFLRFVAKSEDLHPPGYYFLLRLVSLATPGGPASVELLRLVTAMVILLSLSAIWRLASSARSPSRTFFTAAAAVALSPAGIYLDAELRMYGLLAAATLWTLVAAENWVRAPASSVSAGVLLGLAVAGLGLIHYAGLLIGFGIVSACVVSERRLALQGRRMQSFGVVLALIWVPYSPIFLGHLGREAPYSFAYSDVTRFGFLAIGAVGLAALFAAFLSAIYDSVSDPLRHDIPLTSFLIVSTVLLVITFVFGRTLINIGVVWAVTRLLLIAAARRIATGRNGLYAAAFLIVASVALPAAFYLPTVQHVFGANRISTVMVLDDTLNLAASSGFSLGNGSVVVHADWSLSNDWFLQQARTSAPLAKIELIQISDPDNVSKVVEVAEGHALQCEGELLIISRVLDRYVEVLVTQFGGIRISTAAIVIPCTVQ